MGLDASGEENGREKSGIALEEDEGILGDCGRECGRPREEWKCVLDEEGSDRSM